MNAAAPMRSVAEVRVRVLACPQCGQGGRNECLTSEGPLGLFGVHAARVGEALVRGGEVDERLLGSAESSRDPGVLAAAARVRFDRANAIITTIAGAGGAS